MPETDSFLQRVRDAVTIQRLLVLALAVLLLPVVVHLCSFVVPGAGSYVVLSDSMEPSVDSGSLIFVLDTGAYEPGDVITYSHEGTTVTHRIVAVEPEGYRTKGDANDVPDRYLVAESDIHGELVVSVPLYGRMLATIAANRFLMLAGIGLLLLVLGLLILRSGIDSEQVE